MQDKSAAGGRRRVCLGKVGLGGPGKNAGRQESASSQLSSSLWEESIRSPRLK